MSVYASFDESAGEQIASNTGWGDVGRWVDGLDAEAYPLLAHVVQYGWTGEPDKLAQEIESAVRESAPDQDTLTVLRNLFNVCTNSAEEAVYINSGMLQD